MIKDIQWQECNLPWQKRHNDFPLPPDLSTKELETFGTTLGWEREKLDKDLEFGFIKHDLEEKLCEEYEGKLLHDMVNQRLIELAKTNEIVKSHLEYRFFQEKRNSWYYEQPEIIEWQNEHDKYENSIKKLSFCGLNLNKPGTLIEIENGEQYLIGHINPILGTCDDCTAFEFDTVIKRYAVLVELE